MEDWKKEQEKMAQSRLSMPRISSETRLFRQAQYEADQLTPFSLRRLYRLEWEMVLKPFWMSQVHLLPSESKKHIRPVLEGYYNDTIAQRVETLFIDSFRRVFGDPSNELRDFRISLAYITECGEKYCLERMDMKNIDKILKCYQHHKEEFSDPKSEWRPVLEKQKYIFTFHFNRQQFGDNPNEYLFFKDFYKTSAKAGMMLANRYDKDGNVVETVPHYTLAGGPEIENPPDNSHILSWIRKKSVHRCQNPRIWVDPRFDTSGRVTMPSHDLTDPLSKLDLNSTDPTKKSKSKEFHFNYIDMKAANFAASAVLQF